MAGLILIMLSLGMMLFRVSSLRGLKVSGKPLRTFTLTFAERLTLQRTNIYGFGVILLLNAIGHWLPVQFVVLAAVAAYGVLLIPVRYQFTTDGIAMNHVVFRRWSEFAAYETGKRGITLRGRSGNGGCSVQIAQTRQGDVLPLLQRYLAAAPRGDETQPPPKKKGGGDGATKSKHRLLTRRS